MGKNVFIGVLVVIAIFAYVLTDYGMPVSAGLIAIGLVGDDLFDIGLLQYVRQRFRQ